MTGEQSGDWGDTVNINMDIIDVITNGQVTLSLSGTSSTLSTSNAVVSDGQNALLILGGTPSGTHTITIDPSDAEKIYLVYNTTAQSVVFTQGSGGNVTIATGDSAVIYSNGGGGSAVVANLTDHFAMNSVKITGGAINGTPIGATSASTGAFSTHVFFRSGNVVFSDNRFCNHFWRFGKWYAHWGVFGVNGSLFDSIYFRRCNAHLCRA